MQRLLRGLRERLESTELRIREPPAGPSAVAKHAKCKRRFSDVPQVCCSDGQHAHHADGCLVEEGDRAVDARLVHGREAKALQSDPFARAAAGEFRLKRFAVQIVHVKKRSCEDAHAGDISQNEECECGRGGAGAPFSNPRKLQKSQSAAAMAPSFGMVRMNRGYSVRSSRAVDVAQ